MATEVVIGFDLGGTKMAVGIAEPDGTLLDHDVLPTRAEAGAEQAVERILAAGRDLAGTHQGTVRAVGVASMGYTRDDRILFAPNVPGWEDLALPARVAAHFPGTPVRVDNDVKAAALAELCWGALAGADTGVYVNLGTGIAAALVVGGRIVRGAHGLAGEIGYRPRTPQERAGVRAGRAPLEEFVGGNAIGAATRDELGESLTTEEVFARAAGGDRRAQSFLRPRLEEISFHLADLAIDLDPERVVIGGGLARSAGVILPVLADYVTRFVPEPPHLVPARFTRNAGLLGAVALAVEGH